MQFPGFHGFWWETSFFDLCFFFWGQCIPLSRTSEEYLLSCELLVSVYISSVWDCFLTRICIFLSLETASAVGSSGTPLPAPLFSLTFQCRHTSTTMFFEDSLVFAINTHWLVSVRTQTGLKPHFSLFPTTLKCKAYYLLGSEVSGSCLIVLYYCSIVIKSPLAVLWSALTTGMFLVWPHCISPISLLSGQSVFQTEHLTLKLKYFKDWVPRA